MNQTLQTPLYDHLVMVGCGKMGMALLARWVEQGCAARYTVIEPDAARHGDIDALGAEVQCATAYGSEALRAKDALLFAVKPQVAPAVMAPYQHMIGDGVLLSVMAGLSAAQLAEHIGAPNAKVIRVMPNTPAMVGDGVSVCYGNGQVNAEDKQRALALFGCAGAAYWLEDETQMHAVTALSGSGPAYIFHMIEAMTQAGVKAGLSQELAQQLAIGTVKGAGALAAAAESSPTTLRENVTSPNGTTQAGLEVLMKDDAFVKLMQGVVDAAARRSEELSHSL